MALMSKRAQARAEKELHDLLQVPGNSTCADCGARNPSWASWSLGVFLCMRCASIHRKLGTHISKVKSLSMDTWTNDQVEVMRKKGNLIVNTIYNPKNKQPDIPLDADEVDGAMERYIRKKYQEKSLSDGRPEVPSRDNIPPPRPRSPETSPPPMLPSKKSRFLKFGLRSSSSAYPLSKHDKKHRNEQQFDNTSRITSEDYTSTRRTSGSRAEMSDYDLQLKLGQLRDMGFSDNERNTNLLKRNNGDVERTIAALVKLGPSEQAAPRRTTPTPTPTVSTTPATTAQASASAPVSATTSLNPWGQPSQSAGFGISYGSNTAPQTATPNANPWQSQVTSPIDTGLAQSFSNLHVSQNLFPHSTGGYPAQPQYANQATAQQMSPTQQQYPTTSSPVHINNPFMQPPLSAHSTGSNPYAAHMQGMPGFAPSTNPFMGMQAGNQNPQTTAVNQGFNPFGLPPSNSPPQARSEPVAPQSQFSPFDAQGAYSGPNTQSSAYGGVQFAQHQNSTQQNGLQSPPAIPNFQQAQAQSPQFQQQLSPQYFQQQQPAMSPQAQQNPYWQQSFQSSQQASPQIIQQSPQPQQAMSPQSQQNPYWQQQPSPQIQQQSQQSLSQPSQQQSPPPPPAQPMSPQQTGHLDKKSILALYNFPQLAPPKPLASIPEPTDEQGQSQNDQSQQQNPKSPAPSGGVYNGVNSANGGKRSATMPASSMHSAGGAGSRNPFMNSTNTTTSATNNVLPQGSRHASHDSMIVNNQKLQEGRHSPDAFASLSARYMKKVG